MLAHEEGLAIGLLPGLPLQILLVAAIFIVSLFGLAISLWRKMK